MLGQLMVAIQQPGDARVCLLTMELLFLCVCVGGGGGYSCLSAHMDIYGINKLLYLLALSFPHDQNTLVVKFHKQCHTYTWDLSGA